MELKVMQIDTHTANLMLLKNDKNRRISERHVNRLAMEMTSGHWALNGQTISFSEDGRLLDGQHRLHAVIKSGMTVLMAVAFGVYDDNAFETYDQTILKRGIHHIVEREGCNNAVKLTATSRRLVAWEKTANKSSFSLLSAEYRDLADCEIIKYIKTHVDEIQQLLDEMKTSLPYRKCKAGSALLAALIICKRIDNVTTRLFIDSLRTGAGLSENSPIHKLRERLIAPPKRNGLEWETEVMALTIKAWNKYRAGEQVKTFQWRQDGNYPEKFPVPGGDK